MHYCRNRRPDDASMVPFWTMRGEITVSDNILLCGRHNCGQENPSAGDTKKSMKDTSIRMVAWHTPGNQQPCEVLHSVCQRLSLQKEPLITTKLPDNPCQRVGSDLFSLNGAQYLLMVRYFSHRPELVKLKSATSSILIAQ